MADQYDFGNLSPIEFEALVADLMGEELGLRFETFSEGADGGIDARYSSAEGDTILQAKHYKGSTWADLENAAKKEQPKIVKLDPKVYYFLTSQKLTPARKAELRKHLNHPSVADKNILGRAELNALLKRHGSVEKRNLKLWLSSASVLQRLLNNDIAVFTEATMDGIRRVLKVFVENPSLPKAAKILNKEHCLIVSGPPGVGKTTLAQVLAAEYCEEGWELVALNSIEEGQRAFDLGKRQVFIFDDFLGSIKLDQRALSKDDNRIAAFMELVSRRDNKRFILTTRKYILQAARFSSEALDAERVNLTEMVLDLDVYTREIKARILYNHLYHSGLEEEAIRALIDGRMVANIVDHKHYMPRIVEWMTDYIRFRDIAPKEYPKAFIQALDNPTKIWEKPFRLHISQEARIILYCVYLSKREGYLERGVNLSNLKPFFERALDAFSVSSDNSVSQARFEDTLRELKSSFVVLQAGKVEFINPSVQDFLSRQLDDKRLLTKLAASIPTIAHALVLWKATCELSKEKPEQIEAVAQTLLSTIQFGKIGGRTAFDDLVAALGDMLLRVNCPQFFDFLRSGGLSAQFWINEAELPNIIDELMFGRFCTFPHARSYGRLLRLRLYKYLSESEYVLEIEELGMLANNFSSYREVLPECIKEQFERAADESIDALDYLSLPRGSDPETIVGEWLEQMDAIESYLGWQINSSKRDQMVSFLGAIQMEHEMEMERHRDVLDLPRSASVKSGLPQPVLPTRPFDGPSAGFSDTDLNSMFSSLKK